MVKTQDTRGSVMKKEATSGIDTNQIRGGVTIKFPLKGEWVALRTPAKCVPTHGTEFFGQRYAYDFIRLGPAKDTPYSKSFFHHLLGRVSTEDCYCWNQPVFAPFDGVVRAIGEGLEEPKKISFIKDLLRLSFHPPKLSEEDLRPVAGNYVILEGSEGIALFAHLKLGSVSVSAGQQVKCGDVLGTVGHSGNSTMPHLHFQLMDNVNPFKAEGILCKFDEFETLDNGQWISKTDTVPDYMKRIRA